tara:strand:- start:462 stop:809 length:348 start_codon:yes stop_codon:yes gene_type:complete
MAYVVVAKEPARNELVVGWDERSTPGLYAQGCTVTSLSCAGREFVPQTGKLSCSVQPRYRSQAESAHVERCENRIKVHFDRPQRALTPGQVCAFYEGGQLLGGGIFESISPCAPE